MLTCVFSAHTQMEWLVIRVTAEKREKWREQVLAILRQAPSPPPLFLLLLSHSPSYLWYSTVQYSFSESEPLDGIRIDTQIGEKKVSTTVRHHLLWCCSDFNACKEEKCRMHWINYVFKCILSLFSPKRLYFWAVEEGFGVRSPKSACERGSSEKRRDTSSIPI